MNVFDDTYKEKIGICPDDGLPVKSLETVSVNCVALPNSFFAVDTAQFPDWNTVKPYSGMCEHCGAQWPSYKREPANC